MHRTTTSTNNEKDVITAVKGPKKGTIELLKQFARAYEYNVELPRGLESMILNWNNHPLSPKGIKKPSRHERGGFIILAGFFASSAAFLFSMSR